jgi:hypothetical protein
VRRLGWLSLLVFAESSPVVAEPVVRYAIEARLDARRKTLEGHLTLAWRNATGRATDELYWHLYLNAFRNARSTYFKERGEGEARRLEGNWGGCEIESLFLLLPGGAKVDLSGRLTFVSPDDGNEEDGTVVRVGLPSAVPPGETIHLRVRFSSRLPLNLDRTGFKGEELFAAQWFPKLGVLEEDGWNCHQAHASSEYYADFGSYDVSLRLPSELVVGATGKLDSVIDHRDGTVTYRFRQDEVHDFAWAASPHFQVYQDRFEHPGLPPVEINLLLQPEHASPAERYRVAVKHALRFFGEWFGPYPYPTLTVVDPVRESGADGMEYPTLVAAGADWLAPAAGAEPEATVLHELAHQFWYGLVANNEAEHPWLDEGFATYAAARLLDLAYGKRRRTKKYFGLPVTIRGSEAPALQRSVERYRRRAGLDVMDRPAWLYASPAAYQVNAYDKPALLLSTLHRFFGDDLWGRVLRTYHDRWRFRHPRPRDFISTVSEVTGRRLERFWDEALWGAGKLDYGVGEVESLPIDGQRYRSRVTVRRLGELRLPVELRVRFADGVELSESWNGDSLWQRFSFVTSSPLRQVLVDPEHKLLLDVSRSNNSWAARRSPLGALGWSARSVFWLQTLLELVAVLA